MQHEKDYFYHYNVFEHNLNFQIFFFGALLLFDVLDNNMFFLREITIKNLLLVCLFD